MKLDNIPEGILDKDKIESVQKIQNELKLIRRVRKVPGHTLFEFNLETLEIKPADIENKVFLDKALKPVYKSIVVQKPKCIYAQALNAKNCEKKILKMINKIKSNGNNKS